MSKQFGIGPNGPCAMVQREGEETSCQEVEKFEYSNSQEGKVSCQEKEQFVYSCSQKEEKIVCSKGKKEEKKTCDDCGAAFGGNGLTNHLRRGYCHGVVRRNAVDPENPLQCKNCLRTFKNGQGFSIHISRTIAKNIDCKNIEPTGYNYQKKGRPAKKHPEIKQRAKKQPAKKLPCECDTCGNTFQNRYGLKRHLDKGRCFGKAKNLEHQWQCSNCMRVFKNGAALKQHKQRTVGISCRENKRATVKQPCDMCGKSFQNRYAIKRHLDLGKCLGNLVLEAKNSDNNLQCNNCKRIFMNEVALNQHINVTVGKGISCQKRVTCDICGISLFDKWTLAKHLKRCLDKRSNKATKNAENSLQCNSCKQVFKSEFSLNEHISKTVGKGTSCREKEQQFDVPQMSNSDHATLKSPLSNGAFATENVEFRDIHGKTFNPDQIIVTIKDECPKKADLKVKMDKNRMDKPIDTANSEVPSDSGNADIAFKIESTETITGGGSDILETLFIKEETTPLIEEYNVKTTAQSENQEILTNKPLLPFLPVKMEDNGCNQDSKISVEEYFCSFCDYSCPSKEKVNLHMRTIHNFEPSVLDGANLC